MKIGIWCFLLIVGIGQLSAQDMLKAGLSLESELEDDEYQTDLDFDFCKPGVQGKSRSKGLVFERGFNIGPTSGNNGATESSEDLKMKLKLPIINAKGFKLLLGWDHIRDSYRFGNIPEENRTALEEFSTKTLKTNRLSVFALKPIDSKLYALFSFNSTFSGDYDNVISFEDKYTSHSALAMLGIKKDENTEYGFGLLGRSVYGQKAVLPFIMFNKSFNKHWGLETILPVSIMGRYNFNESNILLFGVKYNGKRHLVSLPDENMVVNDFILNQQAITFEVSLEKKINAWTWIGVKAGYDHFLSQRYDHVTAIPHATFDPHTGGRPYFKIGLFISPPDCKK